MQTAFARSCIALSLWVAAGSAFAGGGGMLRPPPPPKPSSAPAAKPAAKPAAAKSAPAQDDDDDGPDPPMSRVVIHHDAYKKREGLGAHLNIKVTPPEKAGRKGRVLVELYNHSKTYINVADFWLAMSNDWGDKVEVHITADDIKGGWSALKWVKITGSKKTIPKLTKVDVQKMQLFGAKGKKIKMKHFTDLIKE